MQLLQVVTQQQRKEKSKYVLRLLSTTDLSSMDSKYHWPNQSVGVIRKERPAGEGRRVGMDSSSKYVTGL